MWDRRIASGRKFPQKHELGEVGFRGLQEQMKMIAPRN
jgi:hypothetical protein